MAEAKKATFIQAIREVFGLKAGQTVSGFAAELKALTPEDRVYFKNHFRSAGYEITD